MDQRGASHITIDLALQWAVQPAEADPAYWVWRLRFVRCFAAWRKATDVRTEIPPQGLLPHKYRRKPPYLYTNEQLEKLLWAARALPSSKRLRGHTYSTILGLLAVTGMRVSETIALDRQDVDLKEGLLTIRRTKFSKSRMVPLHLSTQEALQAYAAARDRVFPKAATQAFFVSERGSRVTIWSTEYNFAKISRQVGLRTPGPGRHGHGPRMHDMRHRFAVQTLLNWYRAGLDVEREMPKLCAYLGHVRITDTYWYLEGVPELLLLATERLERRSAEVQL